MQSANFAQIYADVPTLYPRRDGERESSLVRAHLAKVFRPGMLEPQEGGRSSGAVFKRNFGVSRL